MTLAGPPQDARGSRRRAALVRTSALLLALLLALWSFADDSLVGGGPGFGLTQALILAAGLALAASCLAPVAWTARALTLLVSTALALGASELTLRRLIAARYYRPFRADARTLYRPAPGAVREHRLSEINGGHRILYRINSSGFRGDELDPEASELRIVVYGDSYIQAEFSALSETFAERLEQRTAERIGRPVEVVNAGVAGYGPDQVVNKMQAELARLSPDLVLMALCSGNDFGDLLRNKLYFMNGRGELQEHALTIHPDIARQMQISRREAILKLILREAANGLLVAAGLRAEAAIGSESVTLEQTEAMTGRERMEFFLGQRRREFEEYVVRGDGVLRNTFWDSYDADVSLVPQSESSRYRIAMMGQLLAKIRDLAKEIPVPLTLVLIPHPIDVGGHDIAEVDREKYPAYRPSGLTDALEQIAERHGIPCLNLFSAFEARGSQELYFRGQDDHWNARGQDFAAELATEFLSANGQLDEARRHFARRAAGPR